MLVLLVLVLVRLMLLFSTVSFCSLWPPLMLSFNLSVVMMIVSLGVLVGVAVVVAVVAADVCVFCGA